jgi:uncharacterized membrane protein YoaK (UPF0700 family)
MSGASQTVVSQPWRGRRRPVAVLLLLTAVAGGLDAITFLEVDGVFVANQTGNLIFLAMGVAGTHTANTGAAAMSLLGFVGGVALGCRLLPTVRPGDCWPVRTSTGIAVEVALIVGGIALFRQSAPSAMVVGPLAIAIGIQAALARRIAVEHLTGGFITGATVSAAMTSPIGDRSDPWWWYVIAPVAVLAVAAGSVSVIAEHTVSGAMGVVALLALVAWWLSRAGGRSEVRQRA